MITDNKSNKMQLELPIRVLQVVGRMDRGGIENYIMNVYRNIDREMVQFDFLCHYGKEASFNEEIRSLGGKIYEMPAIRTETRVYYWKIFEYISALNTFFSEHKEYRVLHGQMTNTASIYMPIAKKHGVTTRIAHSHNSHSKKGLLGVTTDILKKPVSLFATDYFACSNAAADYLFSPKIIRKGSVKIVPNAIDAKKFRYKPETRKNRRQELGIEGNTVIGCVGRFRAEKNQIFLLDVLSAALKIEPETVLVFVGDGPLEKEIKNRAEKMDLEERTLFLGMREDVADIMQAMDVLAMPSFFEGLPVTGIEAQANGLNVVASTGVPKEMNVINKVEFMDLNEGATKWAERLLKLGAEKREDAYSSIINAGYDINTVIPWLQDFYLKRGQADRC